MGKKDDLIAEAKNLDIELDSNETIPELEAKIAERNAQNNLPKVKGEVAKTEGELVCRRVNRGSRRRIERALLAFQKACDEFAKEIDLQLFLADDKGERIGQWPLVEAVGEFKNGMTQEVTQAMSPPAED